MEKKDEKEQYPGYPQYPANEDITKNEKNTGDDLLNEEELLGGNDLDVPGSELDDADEIIGEEDEENNYYSLGGDNHDALEEDNG